MEKELRNLHIINFISFFYIFFGAKLTALSIGGYGLELTQNQDYIPNVIICASLFILIRLLQYIQEAGHGKSIKTDYSNLYQKKLKKILMLEAQILGKNVLPQEKIKNTIEALEIKEHTTSFKVKHAQLNIHENTFDVHLSVAFKSLETEMTYFETEFNKTLEIKTFHKVKSAIAALSQWMGFGVKFTETIVPIIICLVICATIFLEKLIWPIIK